MFSRWRIRRTRSAALRWWGIDVFFKVNGLCPRFYKILLQICHLGPVLVDKDPQRYGSGMGETLQGEGILYSKWGPAVLLYHTRWVYTVCVYPPSTRPCPGLWQPICDGSGWDDIPPHPQCMPWPTLCFHMFLLPSRPGAPQKPCVFTGFCCLRGLGRLKNLVFS